MKTECRCDCVVACRDEDEETCDGYRCDDGEWCDKHLREESHYWAAYFGQTTGSKESRRATLEAMKPFDREEYEQSYLLK